MLQINSYSGEPFTSKVARNLFSKERCRPALGDEPEKSGPQVSSIGMATSLSSARKRLTGNGAGPDGPLVGPSGEPERMAPAADPGEEVALRVAFELIRRDLFDASLVHVAGRDQPLGDQVPQPLGGIRLDLVVVSCHDVSPLASCINRPPLKSGTALARISFALSLSGSAVRCFSRR